MHIADLEWSVTRLPRSIFTSQTEVKIGVATIRSFQPVERIGCFGVLGGVLFRCL
jgi:hypothetical protein